VDKEWRGFSGTNLEAAIDLGAVTSISSTEMRCFQWQERSIYLPAKAVVSFSKDGINFTDVEEMRKGGEAGETGESKKVQSYQLVLSPTEARYVRVVVTNYGKIPAGLPGAGNDAWLFVDEIVVR
jgi:hexosaminidase